MKKKIIKKIININLVERNKILKHYIYYLLKVLTISNNHIGELEELLFVYHLWFIKNESIFIYFYKKYKVFLRKCRQVKFLLLGKQNLILYNKIFKILFTLNKILKTNDVNAFLDLSLDELKSKNFFLYLPFKLRVSYIFAKNV